VGRNGAKEEKHFLPHTGSRSKDSAWWSSSLSLTLWGSWRNTRGRYGIGAGWKISAKPGRGHPGLLKSQGQTVCFRTSSC
jgi:hypothetical protein